MSHGRYMSLMRLAVAQALQQWQDEVRTREWQALFTKAFGRPPYDEAELWWFVGQTGAR